MTSAITAASIEQFWKKYKLEGKIQFLTLSAGDDRRTRIAVKYLCCDSEVKNVSWNNFRKKIMSGIVVCQRCAIRKSAEDWRTDFFEAIASKPGLFVRWDVVQDGEEIFFRSVCGTCGAAGERRASNQALRAIRAGKSLCRQCATSARGESQLLTVSEMSEALAKLPGHQWVRIDAITRKKNQWQVSGVCLRNDCGAPILSSFANMKKSLAAGHTGCGKCAREIQAESQRITASGVLDYAAGRDLQHRLQNVKVTNVRGRSWIEADCGVAGCHGRISTSWDSLRASLRSGTACCKECARRTREKNGMTREELEALATSHGVAETIQILEMVMLPRKQGSSQRERGARVRCLLHEGEPPFCRKTGDLAKSWRNGTSGCPTCAKITAGLNHRNDLEELRRFVAREAIGPSVEILALVYRKGMGHAHCRCLNCNHVFEQQIGWLKEKIPRGSNGCPECWRSRASTGEAMTKALLSPLAPQPYVIREHWIPANLWPSQTVMLDFLVENSVIIEIHGLQHFEFIPHFHNGDPANFVRQQLRDEWKRSVLPTKGYFFLEVDMRGVKSRADLACELRRQALNLAKRAPEKSGVHALLRIAAICEQSVVATTGHSKSPG